MVHLTTDSILDVMKYGRNKTLCQNTRTSPNVKVKKRSFSRIYLQKGTFPMNQRMTQNNRTSFHIRGFYDLLSVGNERWKKCIILHEKYSIVVNLEYWT